MGSSVAIAFVRTMAIQKVSIAGLILTESFPDVPTMLAEYCTFFGIRAFWPLAQFPGLKAFCTPGMRNQWPNLNRLADVVRHSPAHHIEIFHAQDDPIVPWSLSNAFFEHAVCAASDAEVEQVEFEKKKTSKVIDMGEGSWYVEWPTPRGLIRQGVPRYGVHDKIMMYPQIAMTIQRALQSKDSGFRDR